MNIMHIHMALAGVGQWIECWPAKERVASSITSQDTCLASRQGPYLGERERKPHIDLSLLFFLLLFPSL